MNTLVLIDVDPLLYATCWESRDSEFVEDYVRVYTKMIDNIISETQATSMLGFISLGRPTYRTALRLTKKYKGNRTSEKPEHFTALKDWVRSLDYIVEQEGEEADDLIASAFTALHKDYDKVIIVSKDKDFRQLPCTLYYPAEKQYVTYNEKEAAYNLYYQLLVGDSGDNISGVPGIGPVTAKSLLQPIMQEFNFEELANVLVIREYIDHFKADGMRTFAANVLLMMLDTTLGVSKSPIILNEVNDNWYEINT